MSKNLKSIIVIILVFVLIVHLAYSSGSSPENYVSDSGYMYRNAQLSRVGPGYGVPPNPTNIHNSSPLKTRYNGGWYCGIPQIAQVCRYGIDDGSSCIVGSVGGGTCNRGQCVQDTRRSLVGAYHDRYTWDGFSMPDNAMSRSQIHAYGNHAPLNA